MTKPVIVSRATKGLALTYTELDTNFTNLRDSTITVTGDTGTITNNLNDSFKISGGVGLTSSVSATTLTLNLDNTAVTAGTYTLATITVDAQGRITAASSGVDVDNYVSSVSGTTGRITSTGGTTPILDLATTAVTAGSYTAATITVDAYGRITAASSTSISSNAISQGNSDITITDTGTGSIDFTVDATAIVKMTSTGLKVYRETVYAGGNTSTAITPDRANGSIQTFTANSSFTLNLPTNMSAGQNLVLVITQDATGSRLLTADAGYKFLNAFKTLSTGASAIDVITIFYTGGTYLCSLSRGYA